MDGASDLELFTSDLERYRLGDFSALAGTRYEEPGNMAPFWVQKSNAVRIAAYFVHVTTPDDLPALDPLDDRPACCMPFHHIVVSFPVAGIVVIGVQHQAKKSLVMLEVYVKTKLGNFAFSGIFGAIDIYEGVFDISTAGFSGEEDAALGEKIARAFILFLKDLNAGGGGKASRMRNNFASKKLQRNDFSPDSSTISFREIVVGEFRALPARDMASELPEHADRKSPASHFRRGHIRELKSGKRVAVKAAQVGSKKQGSVVSTYLVGRGGVLKK